MIVRQTDRPTHRQTERQTDGRMDGRMIGWSTIDRQTDRQTDRQISQAVLACCYPLDNKNEDKRSVQNKPVMISSVSPGLVAQG